MAQQTSVDWLIHNIVKDKSIKPISINDWIPLFHQAKAMEKEQIQKAFSDGQQTPINHPTLPHYSREEYYNETYVK